MVPLLIVFVGLDCSSVADASENSDKGISFSGNPIGDSSSHGDSICSERDIFIKSFEVALEFGDYSYFIIISMILILP